MHSSVLGFPGGSAGKESTCSAGDLGSVPGLGRSPGEGKGYPLQYSDLEYYIAIYHWLCSLWGHKESDTTQRLSLSLFTIIELFLLCILLISQSFNTKFQTSGYDHFRCSGSSVQEILQARILEWVAISYSSESSQPRDQSLASPVLASRLFTTSATWEALIILDFFKSLGIRL